MELFELLRTEVEERRRVAFAAKESDERGTFDANAEDRHRVLLQLQYDRRDSDEDLIRFLFTQEVIAAENDSFQGFGDAYTLAAVLLASYRNIEDVPLFARAKLANFDTACGFPLEFMHIAGGADTQNILKRKNKSLWEDLRRNFEGEESTPADLETWWGSVNEDYPETEHDDHLLALYERAIAFNDEAMAREQLERWARQEPDSDSKRSKLKYEYEQMGDYSAAAEMADAQLKCSETPWDRASALSDLVRLHKLALHENESFEAAQRLGEVLAEFDDWIGIGLGRMAIHEVFELAATLSDKAVARRAFTLADSWFKRSSDLALVGLESAAKAALYCGLTEKVAEYKRMVSAERLRINEMMNK